MNEVDYRLALVLTEKIRALEYEDIETVRWYIAEIKVLCGLGATHG